MLMQHLHVPALSQLCRGTGAPEIPFYKQTLQREGRCIKETPTNALTMCVMHTTALCNDALDHELCNYHV